MKLEIDDPKLLETLVDVLNSNGVVVMPCDTIYGLVGVPVSARGRISEIATNSPVQIADVEVNPGDYVLADGSGVVFIPSGLIDRVVETAEDIAKKEKAIVKKINEGFTVSKAMGEKYENMLK